MKAKYFLSTILILLSLLILPKLALANGMEGLGILIVIFLRLKSLPLIVLIEAFIVWLITKKIFKIQLKFLNILSVVILANIVTYPITALPISESILKSIIGGWSAYVFGRFYELLLVALVEWAIYIPFFRKTNIGILNLLLISFIVNLFTQAAFYYIFYALFY